MCEIGMVQFLSGIALLFTGPSVLSACSDDLGAASDYSLIYNRREMLTKTHECNSGGCLCQVI